MEKNIHEFINADGTLISGKTPNIDPKTTAKTTTDASVKMQRQPYNWTIYNIKMQESVLPYINEANKWASNPRLFYEFLVSVGKPELFEEYFEKSDPKSILQKESRKKAYDVLENLLNKKNIKDDVFTKNKPTIEEIKNKENLLLDKLDKIAETIKNVMSEDEKNVIIKYFNDRIK